MKINKLSVFVLLATLLMTGCAKDKVAFNKEKGDSGTDGNVEVFVEKRITHTPVITKVTESELDVDDFNVEIYNAKNVRIKSWQKYSEVKGSKFRLNTGDFKLRAAYGDSTATGFDAVYFEGLTYFNVEQGKTASVGATCKMANVKMAVVTDNSFNEVYSDYTLKAYRKGYKDSLVFATGESRQGYIPAGKIDFRIYLTDKDGNERVYSPQALECNKNDFVTVRLGSTGAATFEIAATFTINTETDNKVKEYIIPGIMKPKDKPSVTAGFASPLEMVEGTSTQAKLVINAPGYIESAVLKSSSAAVQQLGLGETGKDLAALSESDEDYIALKEKGLVWSNMKGQKNAEIDLGGFLSNIEYDAAYSGTYNFMLEITDIFGQKSETAFECSVKIVPVTVAIMDVASTDLWSKFAYVTLQSNANAEYLSVQTKVSDWADAGCELVKTDGDKFTFKVKDLTPGTDYTFRGKFTGKKKTVCTDEKTGKTEGAAALAEGGLENWSESKVNGGNGTFSTSLYLKSITGWATRNPKTMDGGDKGSTFGNYCTYYRWYNGTIEADSHTEGSKAAEISTLAFYNKKVSGVWDEDKILSKVKADGTAYAGYLFLGTYDKSNDKYNLGIAHSDRPVSVSFDYKYAPMGSDKAIAYAKVYDANGNVIAETESFASASASSFTTATLNLLYTRTDVKAAKVTVFFQSGTNLNRNEMHLVKGDYNSTPRPKDRVVGSVLTVDNVKLNY